MLILCFPCNLEGKLFMKNQHFPLNSNSISYAAVIIYFSVEEFSSGEGGPPALGHAEWSGGKTLLQEKCPNQEQG